MQMEIKVTLVSHNNTLVSFTWKVTDINENGHELKDAFIWDLHEDINALLLF
jgi:hypothetical protein